MIGKIGNLIPGGIDMDQLAPRKKYFLTTRKIEIKHDVWVVDANSEEQARKLFEGFEDHKEGLFQLLSSNTVGSPEEKIIHVEEIKSYETT